MTIGSASIGAEWFLNGTANLQREQLKTERQISSGFRVQDAADSPSQTAELIGLGSSLVSQQTYQTNLDRIQAETNAANSALDSGIKLIESARTIALQGAGSNPTASDRQTLASQIQGIQQQIVSLANTTAEGRYIFGGDQDTAAPYQLNASSPAGVDKLTAQTATRTITDPSGLPIYQARTASAIFDHQTGAGVPASDNAFSALQNLQAALANNDSPGIASALTSLESVSTWLNQQQASYGLDSQRISQEQTGAAAQVTSLQTRVSAIRDTDIVQAATDLTQESTAQSAAFAAQAQIPRKSLFDYLG
jgi:flagellar hook-associated protein 3 FlgL